MPEKLTVVRTRKEIAEYTKLDRRDPVVSRYLELTGEIKSQEEGDLVTLIKRTAPHEGKLHTYIDRAYLRTAPRSNGPRLMYGRHFGNALHFFIPTFPNVTASIVENLDGGLSTDDPIVVAPHPLGDGLRIGGRQFNNSLGSYSKDIEEDRSINGEYEVVYFGQQETCFWLTTVREAVLDLVDLSLVGLENKELS